tara:strand:- start:277568 stop:277834 length:267 start_codon:yes stop_codon:yes gene_type:complete
VLREFLLALFTPVLFDEVYGGAEPFSRAHFSHGVLSLSVCVPSAVVDDVARRKAFGLEHLLPGVMRRQISVMTSLAPLPLQRDEIAAR